jgi:NAD(P)-dependent dehydrogenase (short-subunit alcohol dehydrogenase family)
MWAMPARFESKVVVVTGGSSGIGRAVAERVAAEGAAVVIGARRRDAGEEVVTGIRAAGGHALFAATDVTVESQVAALVRTAVEEFGRLDGAFNNAGGVNAAFGPVERLGEPDWRADLEQNLTSVYYSLKHEVPALLAAGGGSIVNNAGLGGVVGIGPMPAYVAAKHGVVGLTRSTALAHADQGLRVNAIVTGTIDTPLFRRLSGAPPEGELEAGHLNPAKRVATAGEVAALVAYLLGDEAAFVNGAAVPIDGGFTAG